METDNKENICRDVLDKLGDAAQNNDIPEHLFISIADDLKRIVACEAPSVTVQWPCFSIHDGPLVDTNINVSNVGVLSNALQPHCPRLIKTQEWYMQTKTWEREIRSKETDIVYTHKRIERLWRDLNRTSNLTRVTAKHKPVAAEKGLTYKQYLEWFNLNQEKAREDFIGRIKLQIRRMLIIERMRTLLVKRLTDAGGIVREKVSYDIETGYVIYHFPDKWQGKRPLFDRGINVLEPSSVIKTWLAVRRDKNFFDGGHFFSSLLIYCSMLHRKDLQKQIEFTDSCPGTPTGASSPA